MSFLNSLITAGLSAISQLCVTFSNQSPVNINLGLEGAVATAIPVYINQSNQDMEICDMKVNFRVNGVSVSSVENLIGAYEFGGTNFPITTSPTTLVDQQTANPTLAQVTIYFWALVLVRVMQGQAVDYNQPAYQLDLTMLKYRLLSDQRLSWADVFKTPNVIIYSDYSVLYGHQTYRDYVFGFKDSKFPGPLLFGAGDFIQLITFASNNFSIPTNGVAGIWARLCGLLSFEFVPPYNPMDFDPSQLLLDSPNSKFKKFNKAQ
jgi:hypothetical protein